MVSQRSPLVERKPRAESRARSLHDAIGMKPIGNESSRTGDLQVETDTHARDAMPATNRTGVRDALKAFLHVLLYPLWLLRLVRAVSSEERRWDSAASRRTFEDSSHTPQDDDAPTITPVEPEYEREPVHH